MSDPPELKLFFLRHAEAGRPDPLRHSDDSLRPLTADGAEQMEKSAAGLARAGIQFDRVVSSPYARARQTAEITARETGFPGKIAWTDALIPGAPFAEFRRLVAGLPKGEKVLFVGHEPLLGEIVSRLLTGAPDVPIDFRKGALCRVDLDRRSPPRGRLRWFLSPRLMKHLKE